MFNCAAVVKPDDDERSTEEKVKDLKKQKPSDDDDDGKKSNGKIINSFQQNAETPCRTQFQHNSMNCYMYTELKMPHTPIFYCGYKLTSINILLLCVLRQTNIRKRKENW